MNYTIRPMLQGRYTHLLFDLDGTLTNPKEGEPGSKTNPLVRFGKEYVYSGNGDLVPFVRNARIILSPYPSEEQKKMIQAVAKMPIVYDVDCPKSSPERLQRFREYGLRKQKVI